MSVGRTAKANDWMCCEWVLFAHSHNLSTWITTWENITNKHNYKKREGEGDEEVVRTVQKSPQLDRLWKEHRETRCTGQTDGLKGRQMMMPVACVMTWLSRRVGKCQQRQPSKLAIIENWNNRVKEDRWRTGRVFGEAASDAVESCSAIIGRPRATVQCSDRNLFHFSVWFRLMIR